ncbi:MAG: glycoside hydrolase family 9 protein, partial [Anaerolinea sp.]|nr:glycoside hydrolase family 9 protein [Anaerolinea sp.]
PSDYDGTGSLAENLSELQLMPADPTRNLTLRAENAISLSDGRKWGSQMYMVSVALPTDGSPLHFTLTPPPADPGPNPAALRYSRVGYLPRGTKQAILEIDWRDSFPNPGATLERKTANGAKPVLTGKFSPTLQDFWKQFAVFDFSAVSEPGEYRIVWAGGTTEWFPIANEIFNARWQNTLDFFFPFQMSHAAVDLGGDLAHGASTLDDAVAVPPNIIGADGYISYEADGASGYVPLDIGGWFDAGDYDLNVSAQAFVVHQLSLAWEEFEPQRDIHSLDVAHRRLNANQPNHIPDLLEQIEWGTRWLLSMQATDGRVFVGVVESPEQYGKNALPEEMTDGIPNSGDERWLFHDAHSDVNLKFVAAMAAASRVLSKTNPQLSQQAWQAALRAWNYFQTHPEVYRETVYFSDREEGREQMISAAAAELYLTQPDPAYLQTLTGFQSYFENLPTEWPAPTLSTHAGFWYAPPFLARLYPRLPEGALKTSIRIALETAADSLLQLATPSPFPLMRDWHYTEWGISGAYMNALNDAYWLEKAIPERIQVADLLPAAYWLYGLHPVNDFTFVFGSGLSEPLYHYHAILHVRFRDAPASVPGAVVPGIATLTESGVLYYLDQPEIYRNNEACIYDAASFLFALLLLEQSQLP